MTLRSPWPKPPSAAVRTRLLPILDPAIALGIVVFMPSKAMRCPKCNQPLQGLDYEGVHIENCPGCGGDWLDAGELQAIVRARDVRFDPQQCLEMARAAKIKGVKLVSLDRHLDCPACGGTTRPVNYGGDTGLIIDKCGQCGGVWVDKGELENIQELVEGFEEELPEDLQKYGAKMRAVQTVEYQDLDVHISRFHFVNAMINGVLDLIGD